MKVENIDGLIVIRKSSNDTKITNSKKEFFSDLVYLSKNDSIDNYEEVGKEVWEHFLKETPVDVEKIEKRIDEIDSSILLIEEFALDSDYRLLLLELKINELDEHKDSKIDFGLVNHNLINGSKAYKLLRNRIIRKTYASVEEMSNMVHIYYSAARITEAQKNELIELL